MSGAMSTLGVHRDSVANIVNTTFRSTNLSVELVDVSYLGIVRFDNVSLSDVTLQQGKVVGTTENDFHYSTEMEISYYPEDDQHYDVHITEVQGQERDTLGVEFIIEEQVMSDCVYVFVGKDTVLPGCPEASRGTFPVPEHVLHPLSLTPEAANATAEVLAAAAARPPRAVGASPARIPTTQAIVLAGVATAIVAITLAAVLLAVMELRRAGSNDSSDQTRQAGRYGRGRHRRQSQRRQMWNWWMSDEFDVTTVCSQHAAILLDATLLNSQSRRHPGCKA